MTEPTRAVFLSYASQDAEAAQRICKALRTAGIEVWFDQSELRGGDAWDQKIRRQIRDCALFVPIISRSTQARSEGYFRLEWRLADQRTHLMAKSRAFVVPVCVDDTRDVQAEVPDSFAEVQWSRWPGCQAPPLFVERISLLLSTGGRTLPVPSWSADEPAIKEKSIAVLPFVDLSEKKDQEYFADGMAEEVLNLLGKIPQLSVIGRTSSFQYKGKTDDLRRIGAALRTAYVVEGSVRRSGDRIRVTAQLIDARDGAHRWSETYDRDASDALTVQDEIAAGLVRALQLEVTSSSHVQGRAVPTSNEAYDSYLRGLHALNRYDQRGFEEAAAHFRHALEVDPSFAPAAAQLARTLGNLRGWGFVSPQTGQEQARAAAEAALKLDSRSALAHAALALLHIEYDWNWPAAQREARTAVTLAPNDSAVLVCAVEERLALGDWIGALRFTDSAIAADPLQPSIHNLRGLTYLRLGRLAEAESAYRRILEISPTYVGGHYGLGIVLLIEEKTEAALVEMQRETLVGGQTAGLAVIYYALHRTKDADAALARLEATNAGDMAMYIAEAYAFRGQREQAFEWLDRAYARKDRWLWLIKGDPLMRNLESEPRYAAFLRKMNLSK